MIYWQLFLSFLQVGLFSIGGGYAAMPLIQSQVVETYQWLTMGMFTDLVTIAEMTPGPITINAATFVGMRVGGVLGAVVATFGTIFPSFFIMSGLFYVYKKYKNVSAMQNVLSSLRPAVVALITSAGLMILKNVLFGEGAIAMASFDIIGAVLFLGAFIILRKWKFSPILVMLSCGVLGLVASLIIS